MKPLKSNRRDWLKTGLLTVGGIALFPHISLAETARARVTRDLKGNALYSPFFKEYIPDYFPAEDTLLAKLNANENPYGPSPKAIDALKSVAEKGNRYAWRELMQLIDKIAAKEGVKAENIMMGPGSSDLLEKTGMVLFLNGGTIVSADPSYMSMIRVAEATGASWKGIPLKSDWSHDLEAMEQAIDQDTKLVYICNPNNPTGSITDHNRLMDFCSRVSERVPVFVDEAYLEFLDDSKMKSMVSLVSQGKDVIIARTFSKIHGMAGLRVGYVVAQENTLDKLAQITRGGMGISYTSIHAALASMDDKPFQELSKSKNAEAREYVYQNLKKLGHDYIPSNTSFIIFPIDMDGQQFLSKMYEKKVGVRAFEIMGKNWCRVSMGTKDEMRTFISAITDVLA